MPILLRTLLGTILLGTLFTACGRQDASGLATPESTDHASVTKGSGAPYVRAAHWFGSGWPVNFWNTRLEDQAADDFQLMKEDGFNTVVLLVPWPGFAPDPLAGLLDPARVHRLRELMRLADQHELKVILRVSYAWDSLSSDSGERLLRLWHEEAVHQGWLDHLEQLWEAFGEESNLLFGFFSWEDLWAVMSVADAGLEARLASARNNGFQEWLSENHVLAEVSARFRSTFASWDEVPVPTRREPAFGIFLQFIDHAWIERFFRPAQARFPRLSMEVRVDSDPVWDGDTLLEWHSHASAWNLPGAEWTTLYWSPSMGGKNQGEELSPQQATERLEWMLQQVLEHTGARPIFIGQFLAEDFTPGYELNGKIARHRVGEFLNGAARPLQELAAGYGLWTWRDYGHDAIANPEFAAGLSDWEHTGEVMLQDDALLLSAGASLVRTISVHEYHAPGGPQTAVYCVEGQSVAASDVRLLLRDQQHDVELGELRFGPESGKKDCVEYVVRDLMRLQLRPLAQARLNHVTSTGFVQRSGMRDIDAQPKPIAAAYVSLNRSLDRAVHSELPLHKDGWMGLSLNQQLQLPEATPAELRFSMHLPADWPVSPRLTVSVDGTRVAEVECRNGDSVSLPLTATGADSLRLRIDSSAVARVPGDERELGCLLVDLSVVPVAASSSDVLEP